MSAAPPAAGLEALVEHIRIAQDYISRFLHQCRLPHTMKWPGDYCAQERGTLDIWPGA